MSHMNDVTDEWSPADEREGAGAIMWAVIALAAAWVIFFFAL